MSNIVASLTNGDYTTQVQLQDTGTYSVLMISNDQVIERIDDLHTLSEAVQQVVQGWAAEFDQDEESAYHLVKNTVRVG